MPQTAKKEFKLPEIPVMFTTPEDRAKYLATHYWEHFDFADTTLISQPHITEQAFVDFIQVLDKTPLKDAEAGIDTMLDKAMAGDSAMYAHFTSLSEKYLYDPNSPMRNEDFYMEVLRNIIASDKVGNANKERPAYRLELAGKNRTGSVATDFSYTLADGKKGQLSSLKSDFVLVFFNNPDCQDCRRVKEHIQQSPFLGNNPKVTILSVYTDEDLDLWKKTSYPAKWINGYNTELHTNKAYDLRAIPCIYLLDKDKRVLLKDATIEGVDQYMAVRL